MLSLFLNPIDIFQSFLKMNESGNLHQSGHKLQRATSFNKKNSMVRIKGDGEEQRPNISRIQSTEKMSQKIYELMSSYIPKDVQSIERQYPLFLF